MRSRDVVELVALAALWAGVAPAPLAWLVAALLGIFGTGVAYVLYFRLIANAGPAQCGRGDVLIPMSR